MATETLKERVIRKLDALSAEELAAVQQLIDTFKRSSAQSQQPNPEAARRVRAALAHLSGNLSETIAQEREERL